MSNTEQQVKFTKFPSVRVNESSVYNPRGIFINVSVGFHKCVFVERRNPIEFWQQRFSFCEKQCMHELCMIRDNSAHLPKFKIAVRPIILFQVSTLMRTLL